MAAINDLRIAGIDEHRLPKIRKEPYIDLHFRLSQRAPSDWCRDFNEALSKHAYAPRIKADEGLFIETWVRSIDEITGHFKFLQENVASCTKKYLEKIRVAEQETASRNSLLKREEGEQEKLNRIIAGLDFGE